jgi:hypothetical protein
MQFRGSGVTSGRDSGFCIHHNNAPSHTSLVVQQFLAEENIPAITQLLCSPDPAQSDFQLLPAVKIGFKGTRFATMEGIKSNPMAELWKISR